MSNSVTDPRADALRQGRHGAFAGAEPPVRVVAIVADCSAWGSNRGDLVYWGLLVPAQRRVVVNASEPPARQRFKLAQEVDHWVCQVMEGHAAPVYGRTADLAPDADRSLERGANVFAAVLLMPESAVRATFGGSIAKCAAAFGISEEAMHWRLYNLGLVAERPA